MSPASPVSSARLESARPGYALVGDEHAALLGGPPVEWGAETLASHEARLGRTPLLSADEILEEVSGSGLIGRGGGGFPLQRKILAVRRAIADGAADPLVVVNASESEPASRKDATLLSLRPHVVLDGAALAARAVGAEHVVLHLHRGADLCLAAVQEARRERSAAGLPDPVWSISSGPRRYVAGESTAVVAHLEGGAARPRYLRRPVAEVGVHGRPTLLNNVETLAHLALIVRQGADRWREHGPSPWTGPTLVTLGGAVTRPGTVVEITGRVSIGELLHRVGGVPAPPQAVLVGGYAGRWVAGEHAWRLPVERAAMTAAGASPGCGLLAVLPAQACGVRETARLVRWLAQQSAGQCGPCVFGLPALADEVERLAAGHGSRRFAGRTGRLTAEIAGRGGCRHPDGVLGLVQSAMEVFATDVARHRRRRGCPGVDRPILPLPLWDGAWR